jgi:hypothetical protein
VEISLGRHYEHGGVELIVIVLLTVGLIALLVYFARRRR